MNNIIRQDDKRGGRPYPTWLIQGFQKCIEDCGLHDLEIEGYPYTWERGCGTDDWMEIRLDRALVSDSFINQFQDAKLVNMKISTSDHSPILLVPFTSSHSIKVKRFRFENAWLRDPMCGKIVQDSWQLNEGKSLAEKISFTSEVLEKWGKEITGSFRSRIQQCKKIMQFTKGRKDSHSIKLYQENAKKLTEIYSEQEIFWRQRCKQLWLKEGDCNSKYFHTATKTRRKMNKISTLLNEDGESVGWGTGLEETMVNYFSNLFSASNTEWAEVINCVSKRVNEDQNLIMLEPVQSKEVKSALFSMHPDKSPGPDGMSPGFYQKYWQVVGTDIVSLTQQFFSTGKFDSNLTDTNIILIPKKQDPTSMSDLRPISLCNVAYKVVSKVLANRLKQILNGVISATQSAFIPGRLISDNIMISYEVMHYMKRKVAGKTGWMALKLDMSKAYDRVEWDFLKAMLEKLGFDRKLIDLFMECVTSVKYKITHSGIEFGAIVPSRGIRQGDPLSSYLFLVCMEGLTALIRDNERRGCLTGIKVARRAPMLSHLFFADDSFIFCKAKGDMAARVSCMLQMYEIASGQKINKEKSSIFFSANTGQEEKDLCCNALGFQEANGGTTYLGLPNAVGRNKNAIFGYLKSHMQKRVEGWDKKYLSKGGKEILLKTVSQALPTYAMSIFLLPKQICSDLENIMCKYWWRSSASKPKGIHWMSWDRMCMKKSEGGLGFRKLHDFNLALLGKQGWRLITNQESMVSKIYKARYYPNGSFLTAKLGSNPSYVWRSVLESQEMLKAGVARRVGNGTTVDIEHDPWLPCEMDPYIHTHHQTLQGNKVVSLLAMDQNTWDVDLINDLFIERDANLILSIPVRRLDNDSWFWRKEKMGTYSVKSAYDVIRAGLESNLLSSNSGFWNKLWNLKIPLKVKHFIWRSISGCLPTKDALISKRVMVDDRCPVCNIAGETTVHVLIACPVAVLCWQKLGYSYDMHAYTTVADWIAEVLQHSSKNEINKIFMVAWVIWKNRNDIVWKQKGREYDQIVTSAIQVLDNWESAQDKSYDNSIGFLTQADGDVRWQQPQTGTIKVNTDAALFEHTNSYSFAMVARDHSGSMLGALSSCRQGSINPELAEAIGIREALSWVKSKDWPTVIIESDCLGAIQAIRCSSVNLSYLGRVIDECKNLLVDLRSRNVTLKFVKRSANMVAHFLARYSSSLADRSWGMGDAHPDFIHVLLKDLQV
ncbi:hypothetical protein AgCh_008927 [Apium graveolens]